MSTKAQVQAQAKTPAAPSATHAAQPPVAVPEREVDRPGIAAQLEGAARLGHSLEGITVDGAAPPTIQRQELPEEEKEELEPTPDLSLMGSEGGPVPPDVEAAIGRARGGGQPLDATAQIQLGERLGHDFSGVRVHADTEADELNRQLSANAFATGQDIFFRRGAYSPASGSGQTLLAHELTHVVQQRTGQVQPAQGSGFSLSIDPELERKADEVPATRLRDGDFGIIRPGREPESVQAGGVGPAGRTCTTTTGVQSTGSTVIQPQPNPEDLRRLKEMAAAATGVRAYHATRTANLGGILREGLQPGHGGSGGAGEAVGSSRFVEHSRGRVHFATKKETGEFYRDRVLGGADNAEILKLSLPSDLGAASEPDPDSAEQMGAFRTEQAIPPRYIRRTVPEELPVRRSGGAVRQRFGPGSAAYEHQLKGDAELQALMSYMPEYADRDVSELTEEEKTELYLLRNALRAHGGLD